VLAIQTVHTSGVNWESVATIVTAIVVVLGAVTAWIGRQISHAVTDLSDKLEARLETKETVTAIHTRLSIVESELRRKVKWTKDDVG
jgi:hypothetical protein